MSRSRTRRDFIKDVVVACTAAASVLPGCDGGSPNSSPSTPVTAPTDRRRVAVIGAGLSGLMAAAELEARGFDVHVFEAQSRIGGRVHTLRNHFDDGLWADIGACWIPGSHDLVFEQTSRCGLDLLPARDPARSHLEYRLFMRGCHIVETTAGLSAKDSSGNPVPLPLDLRDDERALGIEGMRKKYVLDAIGEIGDPRAAGWPTDAVMKFDEMTLSELMRSRGASPDAIAVLRLGLYDDWGEGADKVSALCVLRDVAQLPIESTTWRVVAGGNDRLPTAMATRLGRVPRTGIVVRSVRQRPNGVSLELTENGRSESFECERVVCTVPLKILGKIEFDPPLPPAISAAVREIAMTSIARTFIQTKTKFWLARNCWGDAVTDLEVQAVVESSLAQSGTRGILSTYTAAANARGLSGLSEEDRRRRILDDMSRIHPEIRDQAETSFSVDWDRVQHIEGAFAAFSVGQMKRHGAAFDRAHGRVHFAGEHTSTCPGWMQGALVSGRRAAAEVAAT